MEPDCTKFGRGRWLGAALAAVAAWAAAEVLLRTFAPRHMAGIPSSYEYDEAVGARFRKGIHLLETTDHLQELRTNALGTVNFEESFSGYGRRVFCLGDSNTQGTGLPADAAYPFQLGLALNIDAAGRHAPRYGVVNLGVGAFGPRQSILLFERYARELGRPEFALFLGSENDADDDRLFASGYRHHHLVQGSPVWGAFAKPLLVLNRLETVKRLKLALYAIRRRRLLGSDGPSGSVAERIWPEIARLNALCRRDGTRLVVSWSSYPSPSYDWLRDRARAEGLAFSDWGPSVESVRKDIPRLGLENPHSAGHPRAWVARLIADAFAREIRGLEAGKR